MKIFLFINPLSGSYTPHVVTQLVNAGLSPEVFSVTTPDEISSCCLRINEKWQDPLIIVAGGDGTFNAVINGLKANSATLAILPIGTSNVLAAELGIKTVTTGIEKITRGNTRPLSVGLLEMEHGSRRFVLMAGIGLDGTVVRDIRPLAKRLFKKGAYAFSALTSTFRWDPALIEITTDERRLECHSVIICSASRYGGNFILAPEADIFSPELTAVCICKNERREYIRMAYQLFCKKGDLSSKRISIPVTGLDIHGVKPIQIDGDFVGYSPAKVTTVQDFARIIV